jgi:hypothetical protein
VPGLGCSLVKSTRGHARIHPFRFYDLRMASQKLKQIGCLQRDIERGVNLIEFFDVGSSTSSATFTTLQPEGKAWINVQESCVHGVERYLGVKA